MKPKSFLIQRRSSLHRARSRHRGFALVITLSLMVLLTVLAIGLLSLSTISLRTSSHGEAMQVARSNARLALALAIGQLQKTAGPDQRITAPATVAQGSAPSWLSGVWSGKLPTAENPVPDKDGTFLGYLASGLENRSAVSASQLPDTTDGALLVGTGSLGNSSAAASHVRAEKVETPAAGSGLSGRYAWSVLDEGTKAKADLVRSESPIATAKNQLAMGSPSRFGMEKMAGLDVYDWFKGTEQDRLITLPTSSVMKDMPELQPVQHDVTTLHCGLLTDSARGGLRKDLSRLFDTGSLPSNYTTKRLYDDPSVETKTPNPYWSQLFEYANLYKNLTSLAGGMGVRANVPAGYNPIKTGRVNTVSPQAPRGLMLMPVVAKVQMQFSMVAKDAHGPWAGGVDHNTGTAADNYMVYMIYSPIVTLYNPYNVPLSFEELRLDFKDLPIGFRFYRNGQAQTTGMAHMNQLYVGHDTGTGTPKTFGINLRSTYSQSRAAPVVMQPGETRVFGESVDGTWSWAKNQDSFFDYTDTKTANMPLAPGYPSQGVGFWVDWLTPDEMKPVDDNWGVFPLRLSDSIDVGFGPMPSSASGNRLSIVVNLIKSGRLVRSGSLDLDYVDANTLTNALSRDPSTSFPGGEARLQRPYLGSEMYESPATPLRDFTRAKAFAHFSFYAKTTLEADSPAKPWLQGGHVTSLAGIDLAKEDMGIHPFEVALKRLAPGYKFPIDSRNRGKFFTGHSDQNGTRIAPQYEIPQMPLQNLAQFRHAGLCNQGFLPGATYTAGESFASPMIPRSAVSATGTKEYPLLDHVWLANNALWDGYYFSTLTSYGGALMGGSRTATSVAEGFFNDDEKLLNPRVIPTVAGDTKTTVADITAQDGYLKSASHLMIDGAFNVNSLSVQAWKAFLSSLNKQDVDYLHIADGAAAGSAGITTEASNPFSRMRRANGQPVESFNALLARHGRWTGMRTLTDGEIGELAEHLVEEIKERGPFLSLAEFVNRSPGSDKEQALAGPLQAAIDKTTSINERFAADSKTYAAGDLAGESYAFADAMEGMNAVGAPGYLTQGDILSSLGSVISVRSDTFRVRSYGEAVDSKGKVVAKAWAEAVVQRVPEFVDPNESPEVAPADLESEANQRFGRRFIVTAFRWLGAEEI